MSIPNLTKNNLIRLTRSAWGVCLLCCVAIPVHADDPNNTFATRQFLSPGTTSFLDDLTAPAGPDLIIAASNENLEITQTDDDSSFLGNGKAAALYEVPVNDSDTRTIEIDVSGARDFNIDGKDDVSGLDHTQSGAFDLFIDLYDTEDNFVDSLGFSGTIDPGGTHFIELIASDFIDEFNNELTSIAGFTYDAITDNTIGPHDVDFLTFTDLPAGAPFVAEITSSEMELDSILGWFDKNGNLIGFNDNNNDVSFLSRLQGVVPADGQVNLAVSGFNDDGFIGSHEWFGSYTLKVSIVPEPTTAGMVIIGMACLLRRRSAA